jgi:hypothetical protein
MLLIGAPLQQINEKNSQKWTATHRQHYCICIRQELAVRPEGANHQWRRVPLAEGQDSLFARGQSGTVATV